MTDASYPDNLRQLPVDVGSILLVRIREREMSGAALLIGNAKYRTLPPLQTPVSDITNVGDRLRALGFDVTTVKNADFTDLNRQVAQFRETIKELPPDSSVVVYFAGHGAQVQGENYLIPVDADGSDSDHWRLRALELSVLLEELCWRPDQQKLIALDACRTNGIPTAYRSGAMGLAGVSTDRYSNVHEIMILYSAAAGRIADDGASEGASPFCRAMLDTLVRPDRPLTFLAAEVARNVKAYTSGRQIPWYGGNMMEHVEKPFWNPPTSTVASGIAPDAPIPTSAIAVMPRKPDRTYTDAEVRAMGHLIHKLKAKDSTGRWAYYFILVPTENQAAFQRAIEGSGEIDVEDYGSVVASCYGDAPTVELKAYLKQRYGFDV